MKRKKTLFSFENEYKIGISKKPDRRLKTVDRAVSGKVTILTAFWVIDPHKIEKKLHQDFSQSRKTLKRVKKGAGKTEWFDLNPFELLFLRWRVLWLSRRAVIIVLVVLYLIILMKA